METSRRSMQSGNTRDLTTKGSVTNYEEGGSNMGDGGGQVKFYP